MRSVSQGAISNHVTKFHGVLKQKYESFGYTPLAAFRQKPKFQKLQSRFKRGMNVNSAGAWDIISEMLFRPGNEQDL